MGPPHSTAQLGSLLALLQRAHCMGKHRCCKESTKI